MFTKIKLFLLIILMTLFSSNVLGNYDKLAYDFNFKDLDGTDLKLNEVSWKIRRSSIERWDFEKIQTRCGR